MIINAVLTRRRFKKKALSFACGLTKLNMVLVHTLVHFFPDEMKATNVQFFSWPRGLSGHLFFTHKANLGKNNKKRARSGLRNNTRLELI
jgi:hypothetical protein